MIHKIIGWLAGYVTIRLRGEETERFVNMCRHKKIPLWNIIWDMRQRQLYANVSLNNFWKLRPIARKTHTVPIVIKRHGGPFVMQRVRKRVSFFVGLLLFMIGILLLSGKIWGIEFEGQQYHTEYSLHRFLDENGVYAGMPSKGLRCTELAKQIRRKYQDIGWVSVEKKGSRLYVRLQEVTMANEKKNAQAAADLVAAQDGKIISIVTRQGTPKVHAGAKVKKGDVLISGTVDVVGDGDVVQNVRFVRANGTVVIEGKKTYTKKLSKTYQNRQFCKTKKTIYCLQCMQNRLFLHNPLNRLESDRKYAIISESGQLCSEVTSRSPFYWAKTTYQEIAMQKKTYTRQQAKKKLQDQHQEYIRQKEAAGYRIRKTAPKFHVFAQDYQMTDTIVWQLSKQKHRNISASEKKKQKEEIKTNGNNGNDH